MLIALCGKPDWSRRRCLLTEETIPTQTWYQHQAIDLGQRRMEPLGSRTAVEARWGVWNGGYGIYSIF